MISYPLFRNLIPNKIIRSHCEIKEDKRDREDEMMDSLDKRKKILMLLILRRSRRRRQEERRKPVRKKEEVVGQGDFYKKTRIG